MLDTFDKIPAELRAYNQWCLWDLRDRNGEPSKVPVQPGTGEICDVVSEPTNRLSFIDAVDTLTYQLEHYPDSPGVTGIGFVITEDDPFIFIDLDDVKSTTDPIVRNFFNEVMRRFSTYAEYSPSGEGLHIILRGRVPQNLKKAQVEVYGSSRYMTMTGRAVTSWGIADARAEDLQWLYEQAEAIWPSKHTHTGTGTSEGQASLGLEDAEVINRCLNASNGALFRDLLEGNWQQRYPSQSEADQTFVNFLIHHGRSNEQTLRIWRASPLGQRDKAYREDYVQRTLARAWDLIPPPIDIAGYRAQVDAAIAAQASRVAVIPPFPAPTLPPPPQSPPAAVSARPSPYAGGGLSLTSKLVTDGADPYTKPVGLIGDLAQHIYECSVYPSWPIALASAIGLMAGVVGRKYNTFTSSGLNQYIIVLCPTGGGKGTIKKATAAILEAMNDHYSMRGHGHDLVPENRLGPNNVASGPAFYKLATKYPCSVTVIGEVGQYLQGVRANEGHGNQLVRALLELFESGLDTVVGEYMRASDDNDMKAMLAPAITLVGDSNPTTYYTTLERTAVTNGLIPRFLHVPALGELPHMQTPKPMRLVPPNVLDRLTLLFKTTLNYKTAHDTQIVPLADAAAQTMWGVICGFQRGLLDKYRGGGANPRWEVECWNRFQLKVLRLATLIAVCDNRAASGVTAADLMWAARFVQNDILHIMERLTDTEAMGDVPTSNGRLLTSEQTEVLLRWTAEYFRMPESTLSKTYFCNPAWRELGMIQHSYYTMRARAAGVFKNDRRGHVVAVKQAVAELCDASIIRRIEKGEVDMLPNAPTMRANTLVYKVENMDAVFDSKPE